MPKIALIGAGSVVFTRNLCSDILFAPVTIQVGLGAVSSGYEPDTSRVRQLGGR